MFIYKEKKSIIFILSILLPLLLKAEGQYLLSYFVSIMFCLELLAESYVITLILIYTIPLFFDKKYKKRIRTTMWVSSAVLTITLLIIGLSTSNPPRLIINNYFF